MPQPFLHTGEHCLLVSDLGIDHPVWVKARLRQRGGEEIAPGHAPEHLSRYARGDAGGEQRGGRAVDRAIAAAGHFVQCAQRQAAARHLAVHRLDPERQHAARTLAARFDTGNLVAERG